MKYNMVFTSLLSIGVATGFSVYAAPPTFHIKNKSWDAIEINIKQNGVSLTKGFKKVSKGSSFKGGDKGTNDPIRNIPTELELRYCPTAGTCATTGTEQFTA